MQPALVVDEPGGHSEWGFHPSGDEVVLIGTAPLRVLRPITLDGASVGTEHGRLELLEARVSLFACPNCRPRPGLLGYKGHAGSACSRGPWPPKGFGPTYPIEGFAVAPGDRPSIVLYLRPASPAAKSGPITVTYREDGAVRTAEIANERVVVEPPPPDARNDTCADSLWFGDTADDQHVRPLAVGAVAALGAEGRTEPEHSTAVAASR